MPEFNADEIAVMEADLPDVVNEPEQKSDQSNSNFNYKLDEPAGRKYLTKKTK